jgi:hypothetical protein
MVDGVASCDSRRFPVSCVRFESSMAHFSPGFLCILYLWRGCLPWYNTICDVLSTTTSIPQSHAFCIFSRPGRSSESLRNPFLTCAFVHVCSSTQYQFHAWDCNFSTYSWVRVPPSIRMLLAPHFHDDESTCCSGRRCFWKRRHNW